MQHVLWEISKAHIHSEYIGQAAVYKEQHLLVACDGTALQFKQSAFSFMFYIFKHPSWHFIAVWEIIRCDSYGQALIIAFQLGAMSFPLCLQEKLTVFLRHNGIQLP